MAKRRVGTKVKADEAKSGGGKFPRHSLEKALRVPRAMLDQNAGKDCSERDAARFVNVGYSGDFRVEVSSALKYGLLTRPSVGQLKLTDLAKKILRPKTPNDELDGLRTAVQSAPEIGDVYRHYRGENLPDDVFFENTVVETYKVPPAKFTEFKEVFLENLKRASLLAESSGKVRVLDVALNAEEGGALKTLVKDVAVGANDSVFVMQPFAAPLGEYYARIYEPAIKKAGLRPVRADSELFGTGKIMDQIWAGISAARVLVAELTSRNPNVFYELGLAHALKKPVVLVSSNEEDVPFDLQHIRVIYYDVHDPFWGQKLIEKVAENVLSALKNPAEAVFESGVAKGS